MGQNWPWRGQIGAKRVKRSNLSSSPKRALNGRRMEKKGICPNLPILAVCHLKSFETQKKKTAPKWAVWSFSGGTVLWPAHIYFYMANFRPYKKPSRNVIHIYGKFSPVLRPNFQAQNSRKVQMLNDRKVQKSGLANSVFLALTPWSMSRATFQRTILGINNVFIYYLLTNSTKRRTIVLTL